LNKNIKAKTLKMESFVACDLCTKNVEMSEFEAHYAQCSKPRNAFEVLMCKSQIRCDLCSTLVHNYEFDEHYQNCNGPINAFNVLMNVEKRQPQNRRQNHLDDHPTTSSNALKRMRMDEGKKVLNQGKKLRLAKIKMI